jgi:hypothetical protein
MTAALLLSQAAALRGQSGSELVLEKGTRIVLQLNDHLSTKLNKEGDVFTASVVTPVYLRERLAIPKGSVLTGSVSRLQRPGRFRGRAAMNLLFESIRPPGKTAVPVTATLVRVDEEGGPGPEGGISGEGSVGKDAGTVAKPGLAGAGIGALVGGGKGAAIGAGIGAAAGLATVFATRGKDLELKRGSTLEIVLDRPLSLPPEHESPSTSKIR